MQRKALSLSLIFSWICATWTFPACPVIELDEGKVVGDVREDRKGGKFFAFQSVPYAKPPVGDLRFKAPEAVEPWTGTLNATTDIPKCVQPVFEKPGEFMGQEDCLYLNIYTPKLPSGGEGKGLLPVMVFIHGGGMTAGWASILGTGPEYLMPEGVVLITIHYRLGAFGFLNYDDKAAEISPNNGFKDQNLALKWIQKNVRKFGGNQNLVTIFGESSGGVSAHLHMLSPLSKGLFHRIIAQSGCALINGNQGLPNSALLLGKQLGLERLRGAELGNKLRQLSTGEIYRSQFNLSWYPKVHELWPGGPIVEPPGPNAFLTAKPETYVTSGNFSRVPMLLGFNNRESLYFIASGQIADGIIKFSEQYPYDLGQDNPEKIRKLLDKLKDHYLGGVASDEPTEGFLDLLDDVWFRVKIVYAAEEHVKFGKVFFYEFSGDTKLNYFKRSSNLTANRKGAGHADELGYLFKTSPSLVVDKGSIEDISISRMVKLWTNFAKFGNPTPKKFAILENLIWPPVEEGKLNYMQIGNSLKVGELWDENLEFWKKMYQES